FHRLTYTDRGRSRLTGRSSSPLPAAVSKLLLRLTTSSVQDASMRGCTLCWMACTECGALAKEPCPLRWRAHKEHPLVCDDLQSSLPQRHAWRYPDFRPADNGGRMDRRGRLQRARGRKCCLRWPLMRIAGCAHGTRGS